MNDNKINSPKSSFQTEIAGVNVYKTLSPRHNEKVKHSPIDLSVFVIVVIHEAAIIVDSRNLPLIHHVGGKQMETLS